MTTTQDLRALIARLQARLGEGTWERDPYDKPNMQIIACGNEVIVYHSRHARQIDSQVVSNHNLICVIRNELPAQIARWLARLDEADTAKIKYRSALDRGHRTAAACYESEAGTLLRTVTEDVQAWAVRLGVGDA